jgi:hypothetical protein
MWLVLLRSPEHARFAAGRLEEYAALRRREPEGLHSYPIRLGVGPGRAMGAWCNGVTGVLQLYLRAIKRQAASPRLEALFIDAATSVACLPADLPILCCGSAARALFLSEVTEVTGDAAFRRRGRALMDSAMKHAAAADHSLFSGKTGIAWVALALAAPGVRRPLPFAT